MGLTPDPCGVPDSTGLHWPLSRTPHSGCWRAISVEAPKASVVNAAFPAPVVYANHEMSHRVADMVMGALAAI